MVCVVHCRQHFWLKVNSVFTDVVFLCRKLCLMMGPVTVLFYLELIPMGVYSICFLFSGKLTLHSGLLLIMKIGHMLIAGEAAANVRICGKFNSLKITLVYP